jgi:hypothetical protein
MSEDSPPKVVIARDALTIAAKRLVRATTPKRLKAAQLVLSLSDDHLTLEVPGGSVAVPATGHWPGHLRVPGIILMLLAKGEPPGDPVELTYSEHFLHVHAGPARIKWPAHWEDISAPRIEMALDAKDQEFLQLPLDFPMSHIVSSGLEKSVAAAEKRFQAAVSKTLLVLDKYAVDRAAVESSLRSLVTRRKERI